MTSICKEISGDYSAGGKSFAIVAGRWNAFYTERLVEGAIDAIIRHGGTHENITVVRVPGSYEIPLACRELAAAGGFDGIIALGTVIRGETDHYDHIAGQVSAGVAAVMAETRVPVAFGVITVENLDQAAARAGSKAGNKGFEAAMAAIEMANVVSLIRKQLPSR